LVYMYIIFHCCCTGFYHLTYCWLASQFISVLVHILCFLLYFVLCIIYLKKSNLGFGSFNKLEKEWHVGGLTGKLVHWFSCSFIFHSSLSFFSCSKSHVSLWGGLSIFRGWIYFGGGLRGFIHSRGWIQYFP
jgi:hypothetical protein